MSRDRSGDNGLRPIGGGAVPMLGQGGMSQEQQVQRAIAMEMQAITREIYVRAAADLLRSDEMADEVTAVEFQRLANGCQIAAQSYFVGLGLIQLQTEEPTEPAAE